MLSICECVIIYVAVVLPVKKPYFNEKIILKLFESGCCAFRHAVQSVTLFSSLTFAFLLKKCCAIRIFSILKTGRDENNRLLIISESYLPLSGHLTNAQLSTNIPVIAIDLNNCEYRSKPATHFSLCH